MAGLFDYRNSLLGDNAVAGVKVNLLETNDPEIKKGFDPFMVRRALAQSKDVIVCAEEMNLLHHVDPWMQWNYAFYSIKPKKRYDKWSKKGAANEDITLLCDYFQISPEKASDYMGFLPEEAIAEIRLRVENQANDKVKPKKVK
ncbi:clamp loader of DNA polymerase [Serratia phage vB_SmaA_3M]|uniref:Sliding-clamp-loader small subunit n=1 Tax=Serratia phage vB_SmaA_3M TaxID=2419930 RepID=A0A3G2YS70_9CAUD|nr:clamp loader of DNA polymerase [Serratia phage vB_SmaA_3M]AYP28339.1 putative clamp loader subunit DNA polymerase accessory protein [Serratia phage vB_SmaA_3M]